MCNHTKVLLILFTINIFLIKKISCISRDNGTGVENYSIFGNMPVKDDLDTYVGSLQKIIDFTSRHKHHVDLNYAFGLFLVNAHIKPTVKKKRTKLSIHTFHRLGQLLYANENVMQYFKFMTDHIPADMKKQYEGSVKITSLYSNQTFWIPRMPPLTLDLMKHTKLRTRAQLTTIYSIPNTYQNNVYNFDDGIPSPKLSDKCMSSLADNAANDENPAPRCELPDMCRKMLMESTELGYFICHRLLLFLAAHLGRGCVVYSEKQDKILMREMCLMISDESRYIVMNNYTIKDLLLEQVALCSLSGHAQFLQRDWLSEVLRYQSRLGCFGNEITSQKYPRSDSANKWIMSKDNNEIMDGYCNTHLTAVAAAALGAAIRYILENYY